MKKKFLALGLMIVLVAVAAVNLYLSSTSENHQGHLKITLVIDIGSNEKIKKVEVQNGSTVFDVLNSSASVEYKDYGSLGKLISSIDGNKQNETYYWTYYVDGKFAEVASDKYVLTSDSTLLFNYTLNNHLTNV